MLIIFVFIALNYLLWDRESLVTQGESNQASIEALTRMNMTLNQEKSNLEQQASELKKQIEGLEDGIKGLEAELVIQKKVTEDKTKFILSMKEHINPSPVRTISLEWINNIMDGKYSEAYLKGGASCSFWGNYWSLRIFTDYFDQNVEQIQFMQNGEAEPNIDVIPIKTADWEMSVYIRVHVTLKEGAEQNYLKQGENVLHMTCTYVERLDQWMITSVFSEEADGETVQPQQSGNNAKSSEQP
jgi:cell division protein FtsB